MSTEIISAPALKSALSYANRFSVPTPQDTEDLQQAALEGLIEAANVYRPEKAPPGGITSWAYPFIRNRVLRELHDKFFRHLSFKDFLLRRDVLKLQEEAHRKNITLSTQDISSELDIPYAKVEQMLQDTQSEQSSENLELWGLDSTESIDESLMLDSIREHARKVLSDRDYFIVVRRFGLDGFEEFLLAEIAEVLGMSRQAVSKRLAGALKALQTNEG